MFCSWFRYAFPLFCAGFAWSNLAMIDSVKADDEIPDAAEAAQLGLVIHWQAHTERTQTGSGDTGIALWPHTTKRNEIITIRVGDRIVERIDANEVDLAALQKLVYAPGAASSPPRLGVVAAKEQAARIVARYAKIGRIAVAEEFNQPITYLVAASNDGAIQALNAETGESIWGTAVGDYRLPSWGPGVNDRFVTLVNGKNLYVLDLMNGRLLGSKQLVESAATVAQPVGELIYVPGIGGTLTAYEGSNLDADTKSVRFTGALTSPVVASSDPHFIAWPNKHDLFIARVAPKLQLWSRLESNSTFRTMPQLTSDGFIAAATNGMVFRLNLKQKESIVWRTNLAVPISTPPLAANGLVMLISDTGDGYALDESTGEVLWIAQATDLKRILAITSQRVYAQRKAGQLVAIDRNDRGKTLATLNRAFAPGLFNKVNDRVILQSATGTLVCLREPESIYPVLNVQMLAAQEKAADTKLAPADATQSPLEATPSPNIGDSLFGEPPKTEAPAMSDDPFAAPPPSDTKPVDPLDPFGS